MIAALALAGVLFIVQTWVAALLVPNPEKLIAEGDAAGTAFYDAAGWPAARWLATLTAVATAIAWGFANSLVAQAATSRLLFAMARDRQLPSFLATVHPTRRVPVNATLVVAAISLVARPVHDHAGRRHHAAVHAGQLRCADGVPPAARVRGRALRRAEEEPRLWRHLAVPVLGFAILLYVIINAQVAAQRLGFTWLAIGLVLMGVLLATGRKPELTGGGRPVSDLRVVALEPDARAAALHLRRRRAAADRAAGHRRGARHRGLLRRAGAQRRRPAQPGLRVPLPEPGHRPDRTSRAPSPGDTLAVHLVEIAPARDWAVSATFPHFGALTATHNTAMLHDPLEERRLGLRGRPRAGHLPVPAAPRRPGGRAAARPDARHDRRRPGRRRGVREHHPRRPRREHGHPGDAGRDDGLLRRQRARRRCCPSATGTAARARARCAAPRSRPRCAPSSSST